MELSNSNTMFVFLLALSTYIQGITIKSECKEIVVPIKKHLTMDCEFDETLSMSYFVMWIKVQYDSKEHLISNNLFLMSPFSESTHTNNDTGEERPRFSLGNTENLKLLIFPSGLEDNGLYTCKLTTINKKLIKAVSYNVTVYEPASELELTNNHSMVSNGKIEEFKFKLNDPGFVQCSALGGYPTPRMMIFRGDEDITRQFNLDKEEIKKGSKGLQSIVNRITLSTDNFKVNVEDSDEKLKCELRVKNLSQHLRKKLKRHEQVVIKVIYAPQFYCSAVRGANIGEKNVVIDCLINGYPQVSEQSIFWTSSSEPISSSTSEPEDQILVQTKSYNITDGDSEFSVENEIQVSGRVRTVLTLYTVNVTHYRRYKITASNSIGTSSFFIDLGPVTTKPLATTTTTQEFQKKPDSYEVVGGNKASNLPCFSAIQLLVAILVLVATLII